ncbi:MAG: DNA polymerase III subunit delta [Clostridia bacterium]
MPQIKGSEFNKYLKTNKLENVYILYGQEKYFLKKLQVILEKKVPISGDKVFNYHEFSDTSEVDDIADAVFGMPFFSENKLVIVKDYDLKTKKETEINKLNELLEDLNPSTILIFTYPTINFKQDNRWKKFIKKITDIGIAVNFDTLTTYDLTKFIQKTATDNSCTISKYNAEKIQQYVGSDMNNLFNEVTKLSTFAQKSEITTEMIENIVVKNLETTVYILIKSIIKSDLKNAYSLLEILLNNGQKPEQILPRISDNFVNLYRVRAALESGKNALAPTEYGEYKNNSFVLTNCEKDLKNFSNEKLNKCLDLLVESDLLLKSSKISKRIVLEELIAKLLLVCKGEQL